MGAVADRKAARPRASRSAGGGAARAHRLGPALFAALFLITPARAVQPDEVLKDPVLEHRAREISAGLRCLVCQNQSIDDSDAPLAKDLRLIVRERLEKGDSDKAVRDYVVDRYGEFVLLRPVFALHTLLLWLTPVLAVLLGGFGIWRLAQRRLSAAPRDLTPTEEAEVAALLRRE
jgi:cytochrome c-type biogenesis protein CcmH